jgi:excisionase family DNA binding protein
MSDDRLVSVHEAARRLGMSTSGLYRLARLGRVPCYAVGPKLTGIRFSVLELKEALRRPVGTERAAR